MKNSISCCLLFVFLFWISCSDSKDPADTGPDSDSETDSDIDDGDTDEDNSDPDGSPDGDGDGEISCDSIRAQILAFVGDHLSCSETNPCVSLHEPDQLIPNNDFDFCDLVAALDGDDAELESLSQAWSDNHCGQTFTCGQVAGKPRCHEGQCELFDPFANCLDCSLDVDPQCLEGEVNALNPCHAENCFPMDIAYEGWCNDSAECLAQDGECIESADDTEPNCPDGMRYDNLELYHNCPGGNVRNICCMPWDQTCTYVASSWTISHDPFTCEENTGFKSVCIHAPFQDTCVFSGAIALGMDEDWPADITIEADSDRAIEVRGTHNETGRTFTCTGSASFSLESPEAWSCEACDGKSCVTCTVLQTNYCRL